MRKHIKLKIVQLAVLVGGRFILWPSWYGGCFCDWPSWYIGRFIFGRFDQTPYIYNSHTYFIEIAAYSFMLHVIVYNTRDVF